MFNKWPEPLIILFTSAEDNFPNYQLFWLIYGCSNKSGWDIILVYRTFSTQADMFVWKFKLDLSLPYAQTKQGVIFDFS